MEEDGKRLCLVCGGQSDSAHFGIDSCRACAAFFRRTVKLKKRYICTQTTPNCEIKKDNTWNCRSCRFNKCLAVGLRPDNVHWKTKESESVDDSENAGPSRAKALTNTSTSSSSDTEMRPSVIAVGPSNAPLTPLLKRIEEEYTQNCSMRQSSELVAMRARYRQQPGREDSLYRATWGSLNQRTNMMIKCISEFAMGSFDCFRELEPTERWTLIQHYLTAIFVFEGSFRTKMLFNGNKDVFMMTYITYVDLNDMESYFADSPTVTDKRKAAKLLRDNIKHGMVDRMCPLMDRADLTQTERMALMGLLMFPPYLMKSTPGIAQAAYDVNQSIHRELGVFYRNILGLEDTSVRFAHIAAIQLCVQGIQYKIMDDMEVYQLLNIFNKKSSVYTVLKQDYVAPSRIDPD